MHWNSLDVSYCDSVEPSLTENSVSTLVDLPTTSHISPNLDTVYANIVSHEHVLGSNSSSCGLSSSSPPMFHSDEEIMDDMTTPDYPWEAMHHRAYFPPQQTDDQYVVEPKDFIHAHIDWFNNPLLSTHEFKPQP